MLTNLILLILNAVLGFFTMVLLVRFTMQRMRISFRNQIGQFVVALTDWIVVPARRVIPGLFGMDIATLLIAWLTQTVEVAAEFGLRGGSLASGGAWLAMLWIGLVGVASMFVYLLMGVVIVAAVLSWVSPHSPVAPMLNMLAAPFLRPIQRFVPPIANVDLSPLVLLLLLQVVLMLLAYLRAAAAPLFGG